MSAAGGERLLIVNADDYGLTERISSGILRGHRDGIITSTSVLAVGPAYPKVAPWLVDESALGVGVHLAAVGEDPPLLSASEIPSLVDKRGHFSDGYKSFILRLVSGRIDLDELEREFAAQLEMVRDLGVPITHLDCHQHVHLWPSVRDVVLRLATRYQVAAVRVSRHRGFGPVAWGVTLLGHRLAVHAGRAGLRHPHDATGIEVAGQVDVALLERVLGRLAARGADSVEVTVHPGEPDDPDRDRYRWGYRWSQELDALTSAAAREAVAHNGFRLATYADLPAPSAVRE